MPKRLGTRKSVFYLFLICFRADTLHSQSQYSYMQVLESLRQKSITLKVSAKVGKVSDILASFFQECKSRTLSTINNYISRAQKHMSSRATSETDIETFTRDAVCIIMVYLFLSCVSFFMQTVQFKNVLCILFHYLLYSYMQYSNKQTKMAEETMRTKNSYVFLCRYEMLCIYVLLHVACFALCVYYNTALCVMYHCRLCYIIACAKYSALVSHTDK